jgi:hypothetical protein
MERGNRMEAISGLQGMPQGRKSGVKSTPLRVESMATSAKRRIMQR